MKFKQLLIRAIYFLFFIFNTCFLFCYEVKTDIKPSTVKKGEILKLTLSSQSEKEIYGLKVELIFDFSKINLENEADDVAFTEKITKLNNIKVNNERGRLSFSFETKEPIYKDEAINEITFKAKSKGEGKIILSYSVFDGDKFLSEYMEPIKFIVYDEDELIDPVVSMIIDGENVLYEEMKEVDFSPADILFSSVTQPFESSESIKITGLEKTEQVFEEEKADITLSFNYKNLNVAVNDYIALDINVVKFLRNKPISEVLIYLSYDPEYLLAVNRNKQPTDKVELNEKFSNDMVMVNKIDVEKGIIMLEIGTSLGETEEIYAPFTIGRLYFKVKKVITQPTEIKFTDVFLPGANKDAKYRAEGCVIVVKEGSKTDYKAKLPSTLRESGIKTTGVWKENISTSRVRSSGRASPTVLLPTKIETEGTFNLQFGGGFKGGSIFGEVNWGSTIDKKVKIDLTTEDLTLTFGDFTTSLSGSSLASFPLKTIRGVQGIYKRGSLTATAVLSESRSVTGEYVISNPTLGIGPYPLPMLFNIIPGSEKVYVRDIQLSRDDYVIDYFKSQITFNKILTTSDNIRIVYEQPTFLFSTGSLTGARVDYSRGKYNLGGTFITTGGKKSLVSPKSIPPLEEIKVTDMRCELAGEICVVKLKYNYIVPNTVIVYEETSGVIKNYSGNYFFKNYRDMAEGKLTFGKLPQNNLKVQYTYNSLIYDETDYITIIPGQREYNIEKMIYKGSERVYLDPEEGIGDEILLCKAKCPTEEGQECKEDPDCKTISGEYEDYSYIIKQESIGSSNYKLKFVNAIPDFVKRVRIDYYYTIPGGTGAVAYDRKVIGLDFSYDFSGLGRVSAEYAETVSDKESRYVPVVKEIRMDVDLSSITTSTYGINCGFEKEKSEAYCKLGNVNILNDPQIYNVDVSFFKKSVSEVTEISKAERDYRINYEEGKILFPNLNKAPQFDEIIRVSYAYIPEKLTSGAELIKGNAFKINSSFKFSKISLDSQYTKFDTLYNPLTVVDRSMLSDLSLSLGWEISSQLKFSYKYGTRNSIVDIKTASTTSYNDSYYSLDYLPRNKKISNVKLVFNNYKHTLSSNSKDSVGLSFNYLFKKNLSSSFSSSIQHVAGTKTTNLSMATNYKRSTVKKGAIFDFSHKYQQNINKGLNSNIQSYSEYMFNFPSLDIIRLDFAMKRNRTSSNAKPIDNFNINIDFRKRVLQLDNVRITFSRNDTPGTGGTSRTENFNLSFNRRFFKWLEMSPSYVRNKSSIGTSSRTLAEGINWNLSFTPVLLKKIPIRANYSESKSRSEDLNNPSNTRTTKIKNKSVSTGYRFNSKLNLTSTYSKSSSSEIVTSIDNNIAYSVSNKVSLSGLIALKKGKGSKRTSDFIGSLTGRFCLSPDTELNLSLRKQILNDLLTQEGDYESFVLSLSFIMNFR